MENNIAFLKCVAHMYLSYVIHAGYTVTLVNNKSKPGIKHDI